MIYLSFVNKVINFKLINRIIYWLLYWIWILLFFNYIFNLIIKRNIYKDSLAVYDSVNSSAFVVDVVMVFCLLALHKIKPLNNLIINT